MASHRSGLYAGARAHAVGVHVHHAEHERRSNAALPHIAGDVLRCRADFGCWVALSSAASSQPTRCFGHAVRSCRARVCIVVVGIRLRRSSGIAQFSVSAA